MKKNQLFAFALCMGMTASMLGGCGSTTITTQAEDKVQEMTTQEETSVTIEETAQELEKNVVASSVAIVEILDAMNIPMVGVPTSSYTLPESVAGATQIGNPMSPDMEVVASLEPDYFISVASLEETLGEQFKALGADTYFADLSSYEGLKTTVTELGDMFGTQDEASAVLTELEQKEATAKEIVAGKEAPSVLIIFGAGESFMAVSEDAYVGDLVRLAGGVNVVTEAPSAFSPIDMEYLAQQNPDIILLMAHANPEESLQALQSEFDTNEAWKNFQAVTDNQVFVLDPNSFGMSANLQAGDALAQLAEILYQEK